MALGLGGVWLTVHRVGSQLQGVELSPALFVHGLGGGFVLPTRRSCRATPPRVFPLTVVDNSVFSPTGLTIPFDLVYPPFNSSTLPVSSSEDADAPSCVVTPARVLPPALPALAVCSLVAPP